ncbi:MAG: tetratricopeptide repeat protein [Bacteroides sp.]|nr:tetratricopeptide repeat protein [Bacteroides sp.]
MKQGYYLPILLLLLAACISGSRYNTLLVQADSLMQAKPDSALLLLQGICPEDLQAEADRAYYALLLTQAQHKNYIDPTNDSLILSAVHYYERTENTKMKPKAYYYCGCVYYNRKETEKALSYFHEAGTMVENIKDNLLLSRIYNNMAYIYYAQDLNEQADSLFHKTEAIAVILKDSVLLAETLLRQGTIKMERGQAFYPKAEQQIQQALSIAKGLKHRRLQQSIWSSLSTLYDWMREGNKSIEAARQNLTLQDDSTKLYNTYQLLGCAYYRTGQYDSATLYLNKALPTSSYTIKSNVYRRLADIAKASGNFKLAQEMEQRHSIYKDSLRLSRSRQGQAVIRAEKDVQMAQQQEQYHRTISRIGLYALLSVSTIGIALWLYGRKMHTKHTPSQENAALPSIDKDQLKDRYRKAILVEDFKKSASSKAYWQKMNDILQYYEQYNDYQEYFDSSCQTELLQDIDCSLEGYTIRLKRKYPLLKDKDILFCCLCLLGFSDTQIAILLEKARSTTFRKRKSILNKTMGIEGHSLEEALKSL